jgi:hypothetical protein
MFSAPSVCTLKVSPVGCSTSNLEPLVLLKFLPVILGFNY